MESTVAAPRGPQEQEPVPALPLEADPGGFTERAPAIASLLPDEALSRALALGDAFAVHAALAARLAREPSGPTRDTLRELLARRALFAAAESPPRCWQFLGTGVDFGNLPPPGEQEAPFIATRAVHVLGRSLWPLTQHLVRRDRTGGLEVLGRVPPGESMRPQRWRAVALLVLGLAATGAASVPFFIRDVELFNGLSRAVEVRLDDESILLGPGDRRHTSVFSLGGLHHIEARWPGEEKAFETLDTPVGQRTLYNVLGAALLEVEVRTYERNRLESSIEGLESDETLVMKEGGWQATVQGHADAGRWTQAGELAQSVALADPTDLRARQEAARCLLRSDRRKAREFARKLLLQHPKDRAVWELSQDLFLVLGEDPFTSLGLAPEQVPDSLMKALLHARAHPPREQREAYTRLLSRFPDAREVKLALARVELADGYSPRANELLDAALGQGPESLEELELRVRTLVSVKQLRQASSVVRRHADDPRHLSWELAVLAGRLASVAGPERTQYVPRDLLPELLKRSPEHTVAFALLTGERTVKAEELEVLSDFNERRALKLTHSILTNLRAAAREMRPLPDSVLNRLPVDAAAVLALELAIEGDSKNAERVFGAHLPLMLAREPLETYVFSGEVHRRFPLLPPDLLAAAYLVRSRVTPHRRLEEEAYARWTEVLGGLARRAIDPRREAGVRAVSYTEDESGMLHARHLRSIDVNFPGSIPEDELNLRGERSPRPWRWPRADEPGR